MAVYKSEKGKGGKGKATNKQILGRINALNEELELAKELGNLDSAAAKRNKKEFDHLVKKYGIKDDMIKQTKKQKELEGDVFKQMSLQQDKAKQLGNTIQSSIESIPVLGGTFSKALGLENLGERMAEAFDAEDIKGAFATILTGQASFNKLSAKNVWGAILAAILATAAALRFLIGGAKDLAGNLGIAASQAQDMMFRVKGAELSMTLMGYSSTGLQTTMKSVVDEFGNLDNLSVATAKEISMIAQDFGTSGENIVKINKSMMDLTGMSFEAATNFTEMAGSMARAANVSSAKVIEDIAQNASKFAEFSMSGADGLAEAAIQAAKVGTSLSAVLGVADKLLDFESQITAQFEAQVLTGKNINLEAARRKALEGDMLGLTTEIQKTVGSLGEIQSMNVIERRAIAEAIGLSADDLLKVARGEAIKEQESVQSLQKKTNTILEHGFSDTIQEYKDSKSAPFALDRLVY